MLSPSNCHRPAALCVTG